jgi:hypothetical protein
VWLAAAEVGCSAALTSGCPSRAPLLGCGSDSVAGWLAPRGGPKASGPPPEGREASGSLWLPKNGPGRSAGSWLGLQDQPSHHWQPTAGAASGADSLRPPFWPRQHWPGPEVLWTELSAWRPTRRSWSCPNVGSRRPSLATVTVLGIGGAALIPLAAVAPAMGSLREQTLRVNPGPSRQPKIWSRRRVSGKKTEGSRGPVKLTFLN